MRQSNSSLGFLCTRTIDLKDITTLPFPCFGADSGRKLRHKVGGRGSELEGATATDNEDQVRHIRRMGLTRS
jgi:hypothetical protein